MYFYKRGWDYHAGRLLSAKNNFYRHTDSETNAEKNLHHWFNVIRDANHFIIHDASKTTKGREQATSRKEILDEQINEFDRAVYYLNVAQGDRLYAIKHPFTQLAGRTGRW